MATDSEAREPAGGQELSPAAKANIERYLDNHAREGAHAWQMNMAARREQWTPIGDPVDDDQEPLRADQDQEETDPAEGESSTD